MGTKFVFLYQFHHRYKNLIKLGEKKIKIEIYLMFNWIWGLTLLSTHCIGHIMMSSYQDEGKQCILH